MLATEHGRCTLWYGVVCQKDTTMNKRAWASLIQSIHKPTDSFSPGGFNMIVTATIRVL